MRKKKTKESKAQREKPRQHQLLPAGNQATRKPE